MSLRHRIFAASFTAMGRGAITRLAAPWTRGRGIIFTLHHVRPASFAPFQPNRLLEITPEFLDAALVETREAGFEIVSLAQAVTALRDGVTPGRPFAVFTFDDGYRDNAQYAAPVMRRHAAPWTLFVTTGFADGTARLWWRELEAAIAAANSIDLGDVGLGTGRVATSSAVEKGRAFDRLYWPLRALPEPDMLDRIARLAVSAGVSVRAGEACMGWDELRKLATDPLVDFGAHTLTHPMLAKHVDAVVRREMAESRDRIAAELERPIACFAYPVGDRTSAGAREFAIAAQLGFEAAVTTRPGHVFTGHRDHLLALPRVSLNGLHQSRNALRAMLSGLPFALWNRGRQLNVD